ncbi:MAG: N-glycosylase/DNA lyase [Fervidicoccaceae archaeon]
MLYLKRDRIDVVARAVAELGRGALLALERGDPQFEAISRLAASSRDPGLFVAMVVANALVSYKLTSRGEEFWAEFSLAASSSDASSVAEFFERFLRESRANRALLEQKLSRVRAFESSSLSALLRARWPEILSSEEGLRVLWLKLSQLFGPSKTSAFAVKMAYYAARALGLEPDPPREVPVPVDLRVALVTATSGLVAGRHWREVWRELRGGKRELASRAWVAVAERAAIPPLNLDALLWLSADAVRASGFECRASRTSIEARLLGLAGASGGAVARELTLSLCGGDQ